MNWELHASLAVVGKPAPQPRPRAYVLNGHARVYNPTSSSAWKSAIAATFARERPPAIESGAVKVQIMFLFSRPKSGPNRTAYHHVGRPDIDNVLKATLDSLTACGAWHDDAQIADVRAMKLYTDGDRPPGALIQIYRVTA